ncbi:MAG: glutamyl-tRNA reductase [Rhizobacter sp.]
MAVWALGINHTTAPLDLRGRFAFAIDQIAPTLQSLRHSFGSQRHPGVEAAIISTCNRTEIYCAADQLALDHTVDWLAQSSGVAPALLRSHAYTLAEDEAARHACRVASGLDSMVLGEAQILGQMKDAVRAAETAGALGSTLNQLFQRSFAVAKEVRTATEIGAHSISMAAAAVRLAAQLFEDLRETRVLFIGAGEMIELTATHFAAKTPRQMAVANRTLERGEKLATHFGAEAMRLADLPERLHEFDIVVSCTASSLPLIQALHTQADDWRATEIARARKLLAKGEDVDAVLEALSRGLTQKMLHGTLAELHAADGEHRAQLAQTVSRLFLRQSTRLPADDQR